MPDFEALIRHQQLKKPTTNQRLKVVDSPDLDKVKSKNTEINGSRIFKNFIGGFIGSTLGTLVILFLYINNYLPIDLLKIK